MKRILALLLTMTMFLSLCTVAFAGQVSLPDCSFSSFFDLYGKRYDNAIRYVSLGDSTSMGFYVGTYDNYYCYRHDTPCGVVSGDYSTYTLFSKYLASQGKVRGTDLTSTGMRPMELHAILDEDFFISLNPRVDASDNNGMIYDSWCMDHLDNYMFKQNHYSYKDMFPQNPTKASKKSTDIKGVYRNIHSAYTEAIQNADVITFDLLNGDSLYFVDRIGALLGDDEEYYDFYGKDTFANAMAQWGCDRVARGAEDLRAKVETLFNSINLPADIVTELVDAFLYTYANMTFHFSKCVEKIYELSDKAGSDVKLIVVGPANPANDLSLSYKGITINIGKLMDYMVEAVTFYAVKCDPNASRYYFADCSAGGVETCLETFKNGHFLDTYPGLCKKYIYESFYDSLISDIVPNGNSQPTSLKSVAERIKSACALTDFDIETILEAESAGDSLDIQGIAYQALTADSVTEAQLANLLLYLITGASRGVLLHPSAAGYQQKVEYIIEAYEGSRPADTTYLTRAVKTARFLTANVIGTMLGCKSSRDNLTELYARLFAPVIDVRGIFSLIGK